MTTEKSLIERIIGEQGALLDHKGYNEEQLRSFAPPGTFLKKLEQELAISIVQGLSQPRPRQFSLPLVGFTPDDQAVYAFVFNYEYRPASLSLHLFSLSVAQGLHNTKFPVAHAGWDLPSAADLFKNSAYGLSRTLPADIDAGAEHRQVRAAVLWAEQAGLLRTRGYRSIYAQDPGQTQPPAEQIQRRIAGCIRYPFPETAPPVFVVRFDNPFGNSDNVTFRLLYRCNPKKETVTPKALHAVMGAESYRYFLSGFSGLPHARTVYDSLCKQTVLTAARNILDSSFDNDKPRMRIRPFS